MSLLAGCKSKADRVKDLGAWPLLCSIAAEYRCTTEEILGHRRWSNVAQARHRFWLILHDSLGMGWKEMERIFRCDHTTILEGVKQARKRLEKERAA